MKGGKTNAYTLQYKDDFLKEIDETQYGPTKDGKAILSLAYSANIC